MTEREKLEKIEQRSGWERPILTMREAWLMKNPSGGEE